MHYLFDPDFCNVASGWEKGVVESGVLSAEHVKNVLARLHAVPVPASVETSLQLNETPKA